MGYRLDLNFIFYLSYITLTEKNFVLDGKFFQESA